MTVGWRDHRVERVPRAALLARLSMVRQLITILVDAVRTGAIDMQHHPEPLFGPPAETLSLTPPVNVVEREAAIIAATIADASKAVVGSPWRSEVLCNWKACNR